MIAVVPGPDPLPVQPGQFGSGYSVEVCVRVPADGRELRIQADALQVVEAREQAHLGEHADSGDEGEPDVAGAALDGPVEAAQIVAVCLRQLRGVERVQDRLVVLVHQYYDLPPGLGMQSAQQDAQAIRPAQSLPIGMHAGLPLDEVQLRGDIARQVARLVVLAVKAETDYRMGLRPVPMLVDEKPPEQPFAACEQFVQRVQQQALAEAARSGEEIVAALAHQVADERGLVNVIAVVVPDSPQGLNADREPATVHGLRVDRGGRESSYYAALRRMLAARSVPAGIGFALGPLSASATGRSRHCLSATLSPCSFFFDLSDPRDQSD